MLHGVADHFGHGAEGPGGLPRNQKAGLVPGVGLVVFWMVGLDSKHLGMATALCWLQGTDLRKTQIVYIS